MHARLLTDLVIIMIIPRNIFGTICQRKCRRSRAGWTSCLQYNACRAVTCGLLLSSRRVRTPLLPQWQPPLSESICLSVQGARSLGVEPTCGIDTALATHQGRLQVLTRKTDMHKQWASSDTPTTTDVIIKSV